MTTIEKEIAENIVGLVKIGYAEGYRAGQESMRRRAADTARECDDLAVGAIANEILALPILDEPEWRRGDERKRCS